MGYHEVFSGLISQCREKSDLVIGELGCHEGASTKVLARLAQETGSRLIVIDWFEGSQVDGNYIISPGHKEEFLRNTKEFNFILFPVESGVAAEMIKDKMFDLFWIDADHRYHAIKRDINLWHSKVKEGGVLSGHDYDKDTFKEEFIERDYVEGCHHGVTKAVNERFGVPNVIETTWWVNV